MSPPLRNFALVVVLAMLTACQQAVRPNLASVDPVAPAAAPVAALESIPVDAETTVQPTPEAPGALTVPFSAGPALSRGEDVFARINKGLSPKACAAGSNRWRQRYAGNPGAFAGHIERVLPLLDFVSAEVERAGLPAEFVFIPLVESWYRPEAIGSGGPVGMWQMISSTARNHGIHIQPGYDGRLSPVESTRAALSYLKTLQGMFGDWQAIVMAYNAGEGRMMRAFKRSENRDVSAANRKPHGLSNITYDYVAKLQALSCLIAEPEKQGLRLPLSAQFVPLAPVLMDAGIQSLDQFAARQGKNAGELRRLNPGYKGGRIVAGVPRLVLMPFDVQQAPVGSSLAATMETRTANTGVPAEQAVTHEVRAGESLWSIAKLYRLSIDQLRRNNSMGRSSMVRPGQMLRLVP